MFSTGRLIFVIIFVLVFVSAMVWSYSKEYKLNKIHFPKPYKILIALLLFLVVQFLIVKVRKFL